MHYRYMRVCSSRDIDSYALPIQLSSMSSNYYYLNTLLVYHVYCDIIVTPL